MGKLWLNNEIVDRLAMLQQREAEHPGVNQIAIEKDWWVTVTLKALFQTDCRDSLIFKGGTSLSKGFGIIERFSEDIDLAISHSFFGIEKTGKSQREKLRKMARAYPCPFPPETITAKKESSASCSCNDERSNAKSICSDLFIMLSLYTSSMHLPILVHLSMPVHGQCHKWW